MLQKKIENFSIEYIINGHQCVHMEISIVRNPVMKYRKACIVVLLLTFSSTCSAQFPWQKPPSRSKKAVAKILGPIRQKEPSRDLTIVWVWGIDKLHEKGTHTYAWVMDDYVNTLLPQVPRVAEPHAPISRPGSGPAYRFHGQERADPFRSNRRSSAPRWRLVRQYCGDTGEHAAAIPLAKSTQNSYT